MTPRTMKTSAGRIEGARPAGESPETVAGPAQHAMPTAVSGSTPRICGLDLSLTSTGFARVCGGEAVVARLQPGKRKGHERLEYLLNEVRDRCADADLVVIEGPSYGSTGGREHERGGLWWLIAQELWRYERTYVVMPPATLKRYAAGKGNADKDLVLASVVRRYPAVPVDGNDVADALVLAAAAADWYGCPLAEVPKLNRSALDAVEWPALGGAA